MSELKVREWALPYVNTFNTYIDVGASIGDTSVPFISTFTNIICFEPNPNSYKKLLDFNELTCYNTALSDSEEEVNLIIPHQTNDPEHGSIAEERNSKWKGEQFVVHTKTLDSYKFKDVSFIKIDVEQAELKVVTGAKETIKKYKPVILFENKRNENDCVIEFLEAMGYSSKKYKSDTVAYYNNGE